MTLNEYFDRPAETDLSIEKCPFCGHDAEAREVFLDRYVQCKNCKCRTKSFTTIKEAVEFWNRRV